MSSPGFRLQNTTKINKTRWKAESQTLRPINQPFKNYNHPVAYEAQEKGSIVQPGPSRSRWLSMLNKAFAAKTDDPSSILRTHVRRQTTSSYPLTSTYMGIG